jgi:hypothetical protein
VLVEHAAVWHIAIAVAVALFLAVVLVMLVAFLINHLPPWVCLVPLWLACAYGVGITAVRFARHWGEFPAMRRAMRRRRLARLRAGGQPLRAFERMTFVRVQLPLWTVCVGGGLLAAQWFPRHDWRGMATVALFGIAALPMTYALTRWNEKFRPTDLHSLCPRCGYDLHGSPNRCPECGMRRLRTGVRPAAYDPADDAADDW